MGEDTQERHTVTQSGEEIEGKNERDSDLERDRMEGTEKTDRCRDRGVEREKRLKN